MTMLDEKVRRLYQCDACGKRDAWGPTWGRYSSVILDETCPDQVPVACSDECADVVLANIESGEWALPEIDRMGRIKSSRRGY